MEKQTKMFSNQTLLILGIVGVGLYLYYRNKNKVLTQTDYPTAPNPAAPINNTGIQNIDKTGAPILQTLDIRGNAVENQVSAHFSLSGYKKLGTIPNTI